ncbi:metallopeptidase TldD-related protein [Abyssisolibacter fermentans]|uniref:metallopeptidase TldD-related protein n=1 Tax=Abyssisolibacter fermentans TaxID=1766203 RepID=UPI00083163D1|nr:metallopeptidase TldD-related protein [Abyssisolibacter fermentans]
MINKILEILRDNKNIDGWKIIQTQTESSELFFVKKDIDMNRAKKVNDFSITVYKDFEEDGTKYKGSSNIKIHPTMDETEIKTAIENAAFSAKFIKNEFYDLPKPNENQNTVAIESNLSQNTLGYWLPLLTKAIYSEDVYKNGGINSTEVFLNKSYIRIVTSTGIDVNWNKYKGQIELVTNWTEGKEEVELFSFIDFAQYNKELIAENVKEMIEMSKERAIAQKTPALNKYTVLLTGEPVKTLFEYYYLQASTEYVYNGFSTAKLDENIQGNSVTGDKINLTLEPFMEDSVFSQPYDYDGFPLKPLEIYNDGKLKKYFGDSRYSQYVNVEQTGIVKNLRFKGGSKTIEEMKRENHLEILAFSDFSLDPFTGDFAGEIRLAKYFDGNEEKIVSGGSISGNIKEVHGNMYLSKELKQINNYVGPKTIQLFDVSVAGS